METRVLIPNGLKIVTSFDSKTSELNRFSQDRYEESDEENEEKPSSSSGHFEAENDANHFKKKVCFSSEDEHNISPQSTSDSEDPEIQSSTLIGSSEKHIALMERGRKRGRGEGEKRRKRRRQSHPEKQRQGDPLQNSNANEVKICATRVIDKGTVFSANDGDVQVIHLTGILPIPKDDIRFLFGCFETISTIPSSSTSSTSPLPEISSASGAASTSTSSQEEEKCNASTGESGLIRLCNWIRFLPTTSSKLKCLEKKEIKRDEEKSIKENETISSNLKNRKFFLPSLSPNKQSEYSDSSRSTIIGSDSTEKCNNILEQSVKKGFNIIARFLDGRPIFEVINRLVPGTELVVYFDMESVITQASSITPFAAMMMISNMQMGRMPMPPLQNALSSNTTGSNSNSSTPALALAPFGLGLNSGKNDFVSLKGIDNERERDEKDQKQQHHHQHHQHPHQHQYYQDRLLQFYHSAFLPPHLQQYHPNLPHNPFALRNSAWDGGSGGVVHSSKRKGERDDDNSGKQASEEGDEDPLKDKRTENDRPLDLSKLSSSGSSPIPSPTQNEKSLPTKSTFSREPLKVGTPFDSPDSNEEVDCRVQENLTSSIFSIRNVLRKQKLPPPHLRNNYKLFQPYSLEEKRTELFEKKRDDGRCQSQTPPSSGQGLGFRTSALATPPSSSDSPVVRNSPVIRPILRTRGRERSLLPCEVCGKAFDRPSLLKRHLRTHTGEKPHICDVCSKGFSTSSSLNTHRRIHSGEKPHQCPICGKRFTASSNLYYHRMTHNKEKPHKCMLCGKSFPTPGDLKSHQYVHSGSWPYTCPVCHRGFSKQTNLRNHLLLHSGLNSSSAISSKLVEKPHVCHICDKKFAQASNLRAHIRSHEESSSSSSGQVHQYETSSCSVCKQFVSTSMLANGKCRNCLMNHGSASGGNSGMIFGGSLSQKLQYTSSRPPPHNQNEHQFGNISKTQCHPPAQALSLLHTLPPSFTTFQTFGSIGLPHLPGFSLPSGFTLPTSANPISGGNFPLTPTTPNTPTTSASSTASLLQSSSGATAHPPSFQLQPGSNNTNAILEQILEWNYRMAKESAGNLSLSIVQQKLIESQVLAAQLMTQQHQQVNLNSGLSTVVPLSNFQEYLKMREAAATTTSASNQGQHVHGFPRLETGENEFIQQQR